MSETSLGIEKLNAIFGEYLPETLVSAIRSTEAFANEVYEVTDSGGQRYFIKILNAQLSEAIEIEAEMQQRLLAHGVTTPEYLEVQHGKHVGDHDGVRFTLSRYIPGESPKSVTPELIQSLGATLAKLHEALMGTEVPPSIMQWLNLERVERDLAGYDGPMKVALQQLVEGGKVIFERGLPTTVIHGDLWLSNVFADNDKITAVFDLETAEETVRIIDLARTYTSLRFNSDYSAEEVTKQLFEGYDSVAVRPLTADERESFNLAIQYVAGACATWHAVHGTRYAEPYITLGTEAR